MNIQNRNKVGTDDKNDDETSSEPMKLHDRHDRKRHVHPLRHPEDELFHTQGAFSVVKRIVFSTTKWTVESKYNMCDLEVPDSFLMVSLVGEKTVR